MQPFAAHTASGREVWYLHPERTEVVPEDLRVGLSRQCRYAGAVEWDVLRHSALVARLARDLWADMETTAYAAAHDLHEAYLPDLPAPLVAILAFPVDPAAVLDLRFRGESTVDAVGWSTVQHRWEEHVHRAVGLGWPRSPVMAHRVREVDIRALVVEATVATSSAPLRAQLEADCGGPATAAELVAGRWASALRPMGAWRFVWDAVRAGRPS